MDFNIEAITWDNEKRANRAKVIAEKIGDVIETKKLCNALEFGCGTGLISFNLKDKFEHITLVDTSKGMIETLNSKIKNNNIKNMFAYEMDINNEQALLKKQDIIYTSMAFHHILDTETTLKNLYKLLNEEGVLCIVDLDEEDGSFHKKEKDFIGHNGFNQKDLADLLKKVGFKDVNWGICYNDDKIIDEAKINYSLFLMIGKK